MNTVPPAGQSKFSLLTTQKEYKLSCLEEMSSKKVKVNYSMIIITSSIIKSDNNHFWDEPKEYFNHHQHIRHKEGNYTKQTKCRPKFIIPAYISLWAQRKDNTKNNACPFFLIVGEGALPYVTKSPKETLISEIFKDNRSVKGQWR